MNKSIIDKIKKLLRMKRGGTPAEVETALAMAQKLASEHGIDLNTVDPEEKLKSELGHVDGYIARRVAYDTRYAAKIAELYFNVDVVFRRDWRTTRTVGEMLFGYPITRITFIGRKFETEIAIFIFEFLRGHFARSWNRRANRKLHARHSYVYGMFVGICAKLKEERPPATSDSQALVLSRSGYIAAHFGELTTTEGKKPVVADAAALAGYQEGRATNFRSGVKEGARQPAQLN